MRQRTALSRVHTRTPRPFSRPSLFAFLLVQNPHAALAETWCSNLSVFVDCSRVAFLEPHPDTGLPTVLPSFISFVHVLLSLSVSQLLFQDLYAAAQTSTSTYANLLTLLTPTDTCDSTIFAHPLV